MAIVEAGLFVFVAALAFFLTFFSFIRRKDGNQQIAGFFVIFAMVLFMILSVWTGSGSGVAYTSTITDGTVSWNSTNFILPEGEGGFWLTYVFLGFGALNLIIFVKEIWQ